MAKDRGSRRKQAKTRVTPTVVKRPLPGPEVPADPNGKMMFRLSLMDDGGRWSFAALGPRGVELIAKIAKSFESMTLGELLQRPGNKPIPWDRMCPDARKRARERELEVFDGLWEFRLGGTERLWGILQGYCFYVVWWDPDHEVCPSRKRNT